jgi:hypothetical protein
MDFLFWSLIVLVGVAVVSLVTAVIFSLTIFLGPPDTFDIDIDDNPTTKESEHDSSKHKKTFRQKLR